MASATETDRQQGTFSFARPATHNFPPVLERVALFLATFWPLLTSWSRVRPNEFHHRFRLGFEAKLVRLPHDPFKGLPTDSKKY